MDPCLATESLTNIPRNALSAVLAVVVSPVQCVPCCAVPVVEARSVSLFAAVNHGFCGGSARRVAGLVWLLAA